ncbi:UPF0182 family protein [Laspinema olomoucense]|uniref:UPF0182 family protein n=1 Tax=Laspinema olomoucense TaxID=3231600 RepID=UPI0021BB4779|nr:UPF0182 family protein [Laspinema sp. D3c]MCT7994009.1 UPF0182 family protein [Laspinema sp. D3c]
MLKGLGKHAFQWIVAGLGVWMGIELFAFLSAESLWFEELDYEQVFWVRLLTRLVLLVLGLGITGGLTFGNLFLANHLKYGKLDILSRGLTEPLGGRDRWKRNISHPFAQPNLPSPNSYTALNLESLLALVILLSLGIATLLVYYAQVVVDYWHPGSWLLLNSPSVPLGFGLKSSQEMLQQMTTDWWQMALLLLFTLAIVVEPRLLYAIAAVLSLFFGLVFSGQWAKVLIFFHPKAFNITEPVFNRDMSFYIFNLPIWELLQFWLLGVLFFLFAAVTVLYLVSGNSISEGKFPGFSEGQLRHLYGLGGALMGAIALRYALLRYELLYTSNAVIYGAGYTQANVEVWSYGGLALLSGALAIFLLYLTFRKLEQHHFKRLKQSLGLYVALVAIAGALLPFAVQRLIVQPNEIERERPYIERSIAFTRQGFGLDRIDVQLFNPENALTFEDLLANDLTINNIRLWDTRPLLQTNRQLQQIRLYYKFPDADIDRYTLRKTDPESQKSVTERQQVLISARELDYSAVPTEAQTWVNKHLVYTHGYGFTLSPVNTVGPGGLPDYFVRDIGMERQTVQETANDGTLGIANELIRTSIPIGHPRIYYGELTDTPVMAPSKVPELDYPQGDENVYNSYEGAGGVGIGSWWRRLIFAKYLNNWQMLFTDNFTPETKVLFRRNIKDRIRAIAPFLEFDSDPYLVVANTRLYESGITPAEQQFPESDNYLYWIIDAYTISDRYPYSEPTSQEFNYIRNSVKVVVDAYNGKVKLYIADPSDPLVQSWQEIFPNLLQPLDAMPVALRSHIRYPQDFFAVQSERLLTYHMTDPKVFYNREDQWRVPNEIYGSKQQVVEPYYLIMKLPTEVSEEFILLNLFTPMSRNNLIGWMGGRADGINYGNLLLYQFPKQQLVYGPEQIEARINQDPVISQQISLWNRQGSQALQGNLLVIPIERSLLYVEPLYIEAEENSLPILARVIVAYENRIVMAETLELALKAVFQGEEQRTDPIIRPVEDMTLPAVN